MPKITCDNLSEIFDLVDIDDKVIGQATRRECNTNPALIHRAVFVLIYDKHNRLLWQKRSLAKDINPGMWVTSASGHVDAGESYQEAAVRELKEELGINVPLTYLGKFLFRYANESEFSAIYRGIFDGPFDYNEIEISEIAFMSIYEALQKEKAGIIKLAQPVHLILKALSLS